MNQPKPTPADTPAADHTASPADTAAPGAAAPLRLEAGAEPVPGYRLVQFLGRGGFGEVWKATGPGGFAVALKLIPLGAASGAAEERSAELLRSKDIRHPNLLGLFGAWRRRDLLILAMELADRTLMDRLQEAQAQELPGVPSAELQEYMREAAKGLDHLHAIGVQHRDVKPQNLLLVGGGVKVADFGLAKVLEQSTASNTGSMTPAYAAPEFLKGRVSPHSDQYSLAVAYCQLRGGRLPFRGGPAQVMAGHLFETPDLTALPETERPALLRALAKDPEERYPNCRAFVEALAAVGGSADPAPMDNPRTAALPEQTEPALTTTARPPSDQSAPRRPAAPASWRIPAKPRRTVRTALAWAAAVLLLIGAVAVGAAIWMNHKPVVSQPPVDSSRNLVETTPVKAPGAADTPVGSGETRPPQPTPMPVPPAPRPDLHIASIAPIVLQQGTKTTVNVSARCDDPDRPIDFGLEELPTGVKAHRLLAGSDAHAAAFELTADADAAPVETWVKATARVADVTAEGAFHLTVSATEAVKPRPVAPDRTPAPLTLTGHNGGVWCAAFSHDGTLVASGSIDKTVCIWDASTGKPLHTLEGPPGLVNAVSFGAGDGTLFGVCYGDGSVWLWDVATAKERWHYQLDLEALCGTFGRAGAHEAVGGTKGLLLLDLKGNQVWYQTKVAEVSAVAFSPDGARLACIDRSGQAAVMEAGTGKLLWRTTLPTSALSLAYRPDGEVLAVGLSGTGAVRLLDAATGRRLDEFQAHAKDVAAIAYRPDGKIMATASLRDTAIQLWDAASYENVGTLEDHTAMVYDLSFSPDGKRLVSASLDKTVKIWDVNGKR